MFERLLLLANILAGAAHVDLSRHLAFAVPDRLAERQRSFEIIERCTILAHREIDYANAVGRIGLPFVVADGSETSQRLLVMVKGLLLLADRVIGQPDI